MTSFHVNTEINTVHFDWEDNPDPQHYIQDEMQKIIFVGIGGIAFGPDTRMSVFIFRRQNEVNAKIVHVFKSGAN